MTKKVYTQKPRHSSFVRPQTHKILRQIRIGHGVAGIDFLEELVGGLTEAQVERVVKSYRKKKLEEIS